MSAFSLTDLLSGVSMHLDSRVYWITFSFANTAKCFDFFFFFLSSVYSAMAKNCLLPAIRSDSVSKLPAAFQFSLIACFYPL